MALVPFFCRIKKLLPLAGLSFAVMPVMAPSWTDQWLVLPAQFVRSFPLKSFLTPGSLASIPPLGLEVLHEQVRRATIRVSALAQVDVRFFIGSDNRFVGCR